MADIVYGEYTVVVTEPDGTTHEHKHSSRAGVFPNIGWTTEIPELDSSIYKVEGVHLTPDRRLNPEPKKKTRLKSFMVPRVQCVRLDESALPPRGRGSKFSSPTPKPNVRSLSDAENSGAPRMQLVDEYRAQASALDADADAAAEAIVSGQGWHLANDLAESLHAYSRDAKRNAVALLFAEPPSRARTRNGSDDSSNSRPALRLVPEEPAALR